MTHSSANSGAFRKGMVPWNKGLRWSAGGRSELTRFKKGNRPQTWRPVGSERVTRDGTLERKVKDTRRKSDWKPVKDIVWQAKHGRIPRGWFVVHRNRNRQDFRLRNLTLVNRASNMERNSHYNRYPIELSRLIQLRGALNRQINRREHEKQNRGLEKSPVRGDREGEGRRHAARSGKGGRRAGPGHHQQRQGGNRSSKGSRQDARNRVHPRGAARPSAAAKAR